VGLCQNDPESEEGEVVNAKDEFLHRPVFVSRGQRHPERKPHQHSYDSAGGSMGHIGW